ncbi:zinc finger SWIM domain-containing protein 1-like [Macrosteles quadrilineatus]|uniref:zinc finger SWIM domain-containing protein 1-like n=1 Tax=Macrosteles quadrilineatus TaxID=74068 RepID=UPI0023E1FBB4|nr:zinc finger SWIM domain-containing protein 1-like [Macrosteles quadrilineatus]
MSLQFSSFKELQHFIVEKEKRELIQLTIRDSRTIAASRKKGIKRFMKSELVYYSINYVCIHGGVLKSKSKGLRPKQSTYKQECPFIMGFRVSSDGRTLDLISSVDEHNHDRNKETYSLLPRQRQLNTKSQEMVNHMLKLRVDKRTLQAKLLPSKKRLTKDLHNDDTENDLGHNLQDTLNYLESQDGNIIKIFINEENQFLGLFYQDIEMQRTYSTYPEILFVDVIDSVSNLQTPLYIILVEDSNGDPEIVAFMLLASEDAFTVEKMVEVFKKCNPAWKNTLTIMIDKDFQERETFKKGFKNAELLISTFHTLRSFKREITCDKMGISSGEKMLYHEYARKLTHSKNEQEYNSIYDEIKRFKLTKFINYFEKNWHPIKEKWVPALQIASTFGNITNNGLESINSKVMQVVQRHPMLPDLFQNLDCLLLNLRAEKCAKAAKFNVKVPLNVTLAHADQSHYLQILTPYAFVLVNDKFALMNKVKIIAEMSTGEFLIASSRGVLTTSKSKCSCRFFCSYNLPCHHILYVRQKEGLPLFDSILVPTRWTREFYLKNSRLMLTDTTSCHEEIVDRELSETLEEVLSPSDKDCIVTLKIEKIASLALEASSSLFPQRIKVLNDIIRLWEQDKEVAVMEVES